MRGHAQSLAGHARQRLGTLVVRFLAARLPLDGPLPGWEGRGYRVLFLPSERLGGMLISMSAIRAIAESHPKLRLDVLASPTSALLLRDARFVGAVHVMRGGLPRWIALWRALRFARYDAVIDGNALSDHVGVRTALLLFLTGAPHRIGIGGRQGDVVYTHTVRPKKANAPLVEHLAALSRTFGVDAARVWRPEIPLAWEEREEAEARWAALPGRGARVLLNVAAGVAHTPWPNDRYVAVARRLLATRPELRIVIAASPAQAHRAATVSRDAQVPMHVLPLREAMALVAAADLVLTPDTSLAHAGAAFARRVVTMISRDQVAVAPYRTPGANLWVERGALDLLSVDEVVAALETQLTELEGHDAGGSAEPVVDPG